MVCALAENFAFRVSNVPEGTQAAFLEIIMFSFSPRSRAAATRRLRCAGFTFVEVVVGITLLSLGAGTVLFGLNQLNYFASVNRLYTAAQTLAQNQIDILLTMGPYDPSQSKYPLPSYCGTSSSTNNILRTDVPYYWDPTVATGSCPMSTTVKNVPIYIDPMNSNQVVTGTVLTTVKDTGVTVGGTSLDLRQATVKVSYTFRRRSYDVVMDTMRTSDK